MSGAKQFTLIKAQSMEDDHHQQYFHFTADWLKMSDWLSESDNIRASSGVY